MTIALGELRPYVQSGHHLLRGRPFARFGDARSRELWANWLLCAVANFDHQQPERFTFMSDSNGADGVILDTATNQARWTEHVVAMRRSGNTDSPGQLIFQAIMHKVNKGGAAYASGKELVVFAEGLGNQWFANRVARRLPMPTYFESVWIISLQGVAEGAYTYGVTELDLIDDTCPIWIVRIDADFTEWAVAQIQ